MHQPINKLKSYTVKNMIMCLIFEENANQPHSDEYANEPHPKEFLFLCNFIKSMSSRSMLIFSASDQRFICTGQAQKWNAGTFRNIDSELEHEHYVYSG